ncbi:MAG: phosphate acyltransferase PlsX [Clostridiales bacterium]|jgi:glycerol-3-phosphate acyltransferase PlsX|nr:phosphate acyltransferase PlsX [Clostridiales bacterium]
MRCGVLGGIFIAVDAMGGDDAPRETVKGAVEALADARVNILLVGREDAVKRELSAYKYDAARIKLIGASEVIGNDEQPTSAIRQKKDSSIVKGLNLLKEDRAQAFVSAGATGALLTGATLIVGRIKGVERPALGALLPNEKGFSFLIDSGANVDAKPGYLLQFAKMGSIYMEYVMNIEKPRVGLLNIGAEREKGNALTKEAYGLLESSELNFIGNLEARDMPLGAADVVVCDAFTGNVVLKYTEGFAKAMLGMIKKELKSSVISKLGALMAKGAFKNLKKSFDYSEVGGAPFLGLKALVVKAHGSSDAKAIRSAITRCTEFAEKGIIEKISESIRKDTIKGSESNGV